VPNDQGGHNRNEREFDVECPVPPLIGTGRKCDSGADEHGDRPERTQPNRRAQRLSIGPTAKRRHDCRDEEELPADENAIATRCR
jgi:hypothetical protein